MPRERNKRQFQSNMGAIGIGIGLFLFLSIHLYTNYAASFPLNPTLSTDYFQQNGSGNEMGRSLYVQGKANLVPVYAAGAARQRHRKSHQSSANCRQRCVGFLSVVIVTSLAFLLPFYMVF